ncbi:MAG: REP-associated tyrosine transposase [Candidatus Omnitrophota bacterium]
MGNIKRYFEDHAAYFVTTATKDRAELFRDRKLCRILLVTIEYHKTVFDYKVYGYCLMPDHLHAILHPQGGFNLSFIMKMIKGSFARKINKLNGEEGSLWQKRFYDEMIRNEKQLLNQLEYMHQNPVADGLAKTPGDYPFSSFNQYHKRTDPENQLLQIDLL